MLDNLRWCWTARYPPRASHVGNQGTKPGSARSGRSDGPSSPLSTDYPLNVPETASPYGHSGATVPTRRPQDLSHLALKLRPGEKRSGGRGRKWPEDVSRGSLALSARRRHPSLCGPRAARGRIRWRQRPSGASLGACGHPASSKERLSMARHKPRSSPARRRPWLRRL